MKVSRKKARTRKRICIYCGETKRLTRDHVPPKCLFDKSTTDNMITVPCCVRCNHEASLDDEYFRMVVSLRRDSGGHPEIQKIIPATLRAFSNPAKRGLTKSFFAKCQEIELHTPSGLFVERTEAYEVDNARLNRVARRIMKGLFYHEKQHRLPDTYDCQSMILDRSLILEYQRLGDFAALMSAISTARMKTIGRDVFNYKIRFLGDNDYAGVVLMDFFCDLTFLGIFAPKAGFEQLRMNQKDDIGFLASDS